MKCKVKDGSSITVIEKKINVFLSISFGQNSTQQNGMTIVILITLIHVEINDTHDHNMSYSVFFFLSSFNSYSKRENTEKITFKMSNKPQY